ncbi:MAG: class I SAM-dependent methyltransferase family protein [Promethearchaeota archaeon]
MRKVCIQVDQRLGEQLRVMLVERGLLDPEFPITKEASQLCFPLRYQLTSDELHALEQETMLLTQIELELEPISRKPTDLKSTLQGILPDELLDKIPHSLDIIGEIAIVELDTELIPYETRIGEAIMMINSRVSSVYAKEGGVSGMCRLRPLRLIAGRDQTYTVHTEYGVKLAIDVVHTYFSPRLGTEHDRVAGQVQSGEVIVDMFTGVGPFALLAAKRQPVQVFAIDVNPQAIQCLKKSLELNRLVGEIVPIVGDARVIINEQLAQKADRVIMNLPNEAFLFLDAAVTVLNPKGGIIHFYGVTSPSLSDEALQSKVLDRLADLGWKATVTHLRSVRPAAPHEDQIALDLHVVPGTTRSAT